MHRPFSNDGNVDLLFWRAKIKSWFCKAVGSRLFTKPSKPSR